MARIGLVNCSIDGRIKQAPRQTANDISPLASYTQMAGSSISPVANEMFVTLFRLLSSPQAQSIGIQRRAYFAGGATQYLCYPMPEERTSSFAGSGMNYWDEQNPAGNHAWAAFEFTQGSPSFWVLLQWGTANGAGTGAGGEAFWTDISTAFGQSGSYGNLGIPYTPNTTPSISWSPLTSSTRFFGGVGISFAMMNDGTSAWNGTTNNNGADTKSLPVWKPDAMVWPRANNQRGLYASNRELMFGLLYEGNTAAPTNRGFGYEFFYGYPTEDGQAGPMPFYDNADVIYHTILEDDKFVMLIDHSGIGNYSMLYFGPYTPYVTGAIAPRVALYKLLSTNDDTPIYTTGSNRVYGSFDSGGMNASQQFDDQSMGDDTLFQGGVTHPLSATVVACSLDSVPVNSLLDNPRKFQNDFKAVWTLTNPIVYMNEYPEVRARLGEISWFYLTSGVRGGTLFATGSLAVFGNTVTGDTKIVVPWFTGTLPGIYGSRSGFIR